MITLYCAEISQLAKVKCQQLEGDEVFADPIFTKVYPENNLHPSEQSALGQALALWGNDEDIVVVSDSNHILNGIRVGVRNGLIPADKVKIRFFQNGGDEVNPTVYSNSGISPWPRGFFDQMDNDLMELL